MLVESSLVSVIRHHRNVVLVPRTGTDRGLGSIAAGAQGSSIVAGSLFAFCQSAAMGGYGAAALSAVGVTSGIVAGGTVAAAGVTEGVKKVFGNKKDEDDGDYDYEYSDDDDDESHSDEKRDWRRKRRQAASDQNDESSDEESSEDDESEAGSDSSSIDPNEDSTHSPNPKGPLDPQPQHASGDADGGLSNEAPVASNEAPVTSNEAPVTSNVPPAGGDDSYEGILKRVQERRKARLRDSGGANATL